jgi:MraZ protein
VEADSANRLLLPKRLTDYASIEKEVILSANLNKIEIWSADLFNKVMDEFNQESFESLAEKVMSKIETNKS